jgi:hypothetical protein
MNIRHATALLFIGLYAMPVHAVECMVSTEPRALMKGSPQLQEDRFLPKDGRYTALMKNGDTLLVQYATCDLGISARYFSVDKLDGPTLRAKIEQLLRRIVTPEPIAQKVTDQLKQQKGLTQDIVLEGAIDQHLIRVVPSPSPLFQTLIQYDWIPPEH